MQAGRLHATPCYTNNRYGVFSMEECTILCTGLRRVKFSLGFRSGSFEFWLTKTLCIEWQWHFFWGGVALNFVTRVRGVHQCFVTKKLRILPPPPLRFISGHLLFICRAELLSSCIFIPPYWHFIDKTQQCMM